MKDNKTTINELKFAVQKFCDERNWRQFHNAKELSIGISTEAGELLEYFRFKTESQIAEKFENKEKKDKISQELSDIFYFTLRFAELYDIDLSQELIKKIELNKQKYPISKAYNSNKKYNE